MLYSVIYPTDATTKNRKILEEFLLHSADPDVQISSTTTLPQSDSHGQSDISPPPLRNAVLPAGTRVERGDSRTPSETASYFRAMEVDPIRADHRASFACKCGAATRTLMETSRRGPVGLLASNRDLDKAKALDIVTALARWKVSLTRF